MTLSLSASVTKLHIKNIIKALSLSRHKAFRQVLQNFIIVITHSAFFPLLNARKKGEADMENQKIRGYIGVERKLLKKIMIKNVCNELTKSPYANNMHS
jgi:hypothetical protein